MDLKKLKNKGNPRPGEVWKVRNVEYAERIGVKSRPVAV